MALPNSGALSMSRIWGEYQGGTVSNFALRKKGSSDNDWCPKNSSLGRGHSNCKISHYYGGSSAGPIVGSGGSTSTNGAWKIHSITNSNANTCFKVTSIASGGIDNNIYRMVVGAGGGGGAGGNSHQISGGASRCGGGGGAGMAVNTTYPAVAGAGNCITPGKPGAGGTFNNRGSTGGYTSIDGSTTYARGGGGGGTYSNGNTETGLSGGNGGGGAGKYGATILQSGGTGNQSKGGSGNSGGGGGGGGANSNGGNGVVGSSDPSRYGGAGGGGIMYSPMGIRYGAGGSGAGIGNYKAGGANGGGTGGKSVQPVPSAGYATAGSQKGAGGGGGASTSNGTLAESGKQGDYGAAYFAYKQY